MLDQQRRERDAEVSKAKLFIEAFPDDAARRLALTGGFSYRDLGVIHSNEDFFRQIIRHCRATTTGTITFDFKEEIITKLTMSQHIARKED